MTACKDEHFTATLSPDEKWRLRERMMERCRIKIPEGYRSPYPDVKNWMRNRSRVLYVAKGPSAAVAERFVKDCGTIATVNEAILLVPYSDYAFFSDQEALENCRSCWHRIGTFVCPAFVHQSGRDGSMPLTDILSDYHNVIVTHRQQMDWDPRTVVGAIDGEDLITTDTSVMGLHFLHMAGFKDFLLYGHDGGVGYAPGVPCVKADRDMQKFREQIEFTAQELTLHYGTRVAFADGKIIEF